MNDQTTNGGESPSQERKLEGVINALFDFGNGQIQKADLAARMEPFLKSPDEVDDNLDESER